MYEIWSEEKFLKGIVGDQGKLRFSNKRQKIELLLMQLRVAFPTRERPLWYTTRAPSIFLVGFFPTRHFRLSSISRTLVVFCNLSLWEKQFVQADKT